MKGKSAFEIYSAREKAREFHAQRALPPVLVAPRWLWNHLRKKHSRRALNKSGIYTPLDPLTNKEPRGFK